MRRLIAQGAGVIPSATTGAEAIGRFRKAKIGIALCFHEVKIVWNCTVLSSLKLGS